MGQHSLPRLPAAPGRAAARINGLPPSHTNALPPSLTNSLPGLAPATASGGNGRRSSLTPRPPRSSGSSCEPETTARQHGNAGESAGTRSPRSRRVVETKIASEPQAKGPASSPGCGRTQTHGGAASVAAVPALQGKTVAALLRHPDTREATLSGLEQHATPIDLVVSLAAAPALLELMALDISEIVQEQWHRACLLLARLIADADEDSATVYGAAFGGGRLIALYRSEGNPLGRALRKLPDELTLEDARCFANAFAYTAPAHSRGTSHVYKASGFHPLEAIKLWLTEGVVTTASTGPPPRSSSK